MALPQPHGTENSLWSFARRALIAVAIAGAAYLFWYMRFAALTAFAAILVAVLLLALAGLLRRLVPMRHGWALGVTVTFIVALIGVLVWLVGAQVQSQFGELWRALPQASQAVEQRLGIELAAGSAAEGGRAAAGSAAGTGGAAAPQGQPAPPGSEMVENVLGLEDTGTASEGNGARSAILTKLAQWLTSYGLTIVDAVLGIILVVIAGVYFAVDPGLYHRGAVKLFPPAQHALIGETMSDIGQTLRWWLLGKLVSMAIIGALAGIGAWLIGLPAPLALGIFAGLTEFVPIVGPIVGAVPALLLAATEGLSTVLWTLLIYLGLQQLESNVVAPLVQERMVSIPPALLVLGVGIFGALFGILGLVLSGPLLVVTYVAVKKLWMRSALQESTPLPTDGRAR